MKPQPKTTILIKINDAQLLKVYLISRTLLNAFMLLMKLLSSKIN